MLKTIEALSASCTSANVIIACGSAITAERLLKILVERGHNPVGVADRASTALALAAQMPGEVVAIIAHELHGVRKGPELAAKLLETWGIRSLLLDPA